MPAAQERIQFMDALRGLSILLMVAYHAGYNLVVAEVIPPEALYNPLLNILEPFFAGLFIVLAGVSSRFSQSNLKRGFLLLGAALAVTAASLLILPAPWLSLKAALLGYTPSAEEWGALLLEGKIATPKTIAAAIKQAAEQNIPITNELVGGWMLKRVSNPLSLLGSPILFGILHLMSACILLYALLQRLRITFPLVLFAAFGVLFFEITRFPKLPSADYFPLVPWAFLFFFGVWLGDPIRAGRFPLWFYTLRIPFFPAVGRRSLLIYMLHQPLLFALMWIFGLSS